MLRDLRFRRGLQRLIVATGALACGAAIAAGCAESSLDVGTRPGLDSGSTPSFTPEPDSGELPNTSQLLCLGTECPYPYATCESSDPGAPVYKCQHDLRTDNDNCGACGNKCPVSDWLGFKSTCVNAECVAECIDSTVKDCNGRLEDGCETSILHDPKNCGTCGNACAPGVECRLGTCGCPTGLTECNGTCVDLQSTNAHCGGCENPCTAPDGAAPPPNSHYGCVDGLCEKLRCTGDQHTVWADCNNDLEEPNSDGCEVNIGPSAQDPENCGGCAVKCSPGQLCREVDGIAQCICKPNETLCGTEDFPICGDLANSPEHCGACGYRCPGYVEPGASPEEAKHQVVSCKKGMCAYDCMAGWADCNDNPLDGCETNLMAHGANCGACGKRCNTAAGQPCVGGVCLEVECDGGGPPR